MTEISPNSIIGMSEADATAFLEANNYSFRVMSREGRDSFGTCDYEPMRLNLTVTNGVVASFKLG